MRERSAGRPEERAARCAGRGWCDASVAISLVGTRPDEDDAFAVFVVEQVGEDPSVEARVVRLDGKIVVALVGALRPGAPDLGSAHINLVAAGVVVGAGGLGCDAMAYVQSSLDEAMDRT